MFFSPSKLFTILATTIFFCCASKSFARSFPKHVNSVRISEQGQVPTLSHKKWDSISYCKTCYKTQSERRSCLDEMAQCPKQMKAPSSLLKKTDLKPLLDFVRRPFNGPIYCEGMRLLQDRTSNHCLFLGGDTSLIFVSAFEAELIRGLMQAGVDVEHELESVREYIPRNGMSERALVPLVVDDEGKTPLGVNGRYSLPTVSELRLKGKYSQHKELIESVFRMLRRQRGFNSVRMTMHNSPDGETLIVRFHFTSPHFLEI